MGETKPYANLDDENENNSSGKLIKPTNKKIKIKNFYFFLQIIFINFIFYHNQNFSKRYGRFGSTIK